MLFIYIYIYIYIYMVRRQLTCVERGVKVEVGAVGVDIHVVAGWSRPREAPIAVARERARAFVRMRVGVGVGIGIGAM